MNTTKNAHTITSLTTAEVAAAGVATATCTCGKAWTTPVETGQRDRVARESAASKALSYVIGEATWHAAKAR
jgi:hypothetical protein